MKKKLLLLFSFFLLPVYLLMVKAIGMSKISKASSYGSERKANGHPSSPAHHNGDAETTKTK